MTSSGSSTPISPPSSGTPNDQPSLTSSLLRGTCHPLLLSPSLYQLTSTLCPQPAPIVSQPSQVPLSLLPLTSTSHSLPFLHSHRRLPRPLPPRPAWQFERPVRLPLSFSSLFSRLSLTRFQVCSIYQTATFKGMGGQYDYTRSGNPTRSHLGAFPVFFFLEERLEEESVRRLPPERRNS